MGSKNVYPENTMTVFRNLPAYLNQQAGDWSVALAEIFFLTSIKTLQHKISSFKPQLYHWKRFANQNLELEHLARPAPTMHGSRLVYTRKLQTA